MKKVIDGKLYDSEKATLIGGWDNGYFPSDFNWCAEDLYRTKNGAFFIYGEGGANSKYAEYVGNMRTKGENIQVLSVAEALAWCEDHLKTEEFVEHFHGMIEEA